MKQVENIKVVKYYGNVVTQTLDTAGALNLRKGQSISNAKVMLF